MYQDAARFSSLVFLLASVWLTPTVSYGNRVVCTEVITRAMKACRRMMGAGPNEKWEEEESGIDGNPRSFNAVLDSAAGAIVFGIVVIQTRDGAGMLRLRLVLGCCEHVVAGMLGSCAGSWLAPICVSVGLHPVVYAPGFLRD